MSASKAKVTKSSQIRKFITEHPEIKDKIAIARRLVEMGLYDNVEIARMNVRYVTGSLGNKNREEIKSTPLAKFFYSGFEKWAQENLNTELAPWNEPFIIPTSIKQLSIIADLHSVHLDHKVLELFIRTTKDKEALLINGDLMDSESLSRHLKGDSTIPYEKELELCHQILKGLKQEFTHVYFKEGNHDFWLERYLLMNAREIFKALGKQLDLLLKCPELGVHHIHNLKYIQYGDLDIVHGHEFPGFGMGKFPATGLLDKWQTFKHRYDVKILGAHSHRHDESLSKKSKDGKYGQGWIIPAMCKRGASYAPYAGWDNGWATAKIGENGTEIEITKL